LYDTERLLLFEERSGREGWRDDVMTCHDVTALYGRSVTSSTRWWRSTAAWRAAVV